MDDLIKKINKFRDDRDWRKFHNEKDLAISISLEASELWSCSNGNSQKRLSVIH